MIKLQKLFEAQEKLDRRINTEHPVKEGEDRLALKVNAICTEIGELSNELKGITKFWSNKQNDMDKALYECVDVLHFLLSLGNDLGVGQEIYINGVSVDKSEESIVYNILELHAAALRFYTYGTEECWQDMFESFYTLVMRLGFTWDKVFEAYFIKNKTNLDRQEEKY